MMSDDAISQEEIDALLNGGLVGGDSSPEPAADTSSAGGDDMDSGAGEVQRGTAVYLYAVLRRACVAEKFQFGAG